MAAGIAAGKAFSKTELADMILEKLSTPRVICRRFNDIITNDKASPGLKRALFIAPSPDPQSEHTVWKRVPIGHRSWNCFIGDSTETAIDPRSRPMHELNPAIARYEVVPRTQAFDIDSDARAFGNGILVFDAQAFAIFFRTQCLPSENPLLIRPGCNAVTLELQHEMGSCCWERDGLGPNCWFRRCATIGLRTSEPHGFVTLADVERVIDAAWRSAGGLI